MSIYIIIPVPFIFATIALITQRTHLLISLFCLEGILLSLVLMIPTMLHSSIILNAPTLALILLTLGACEARLGLRLMVNMSRMYGSDILSSLTSNKC